MKKVSFFLIYIRLTLFLISILGLFSCRDAAPIKPFKKIKHPVIIDKCDTFSVSFSKDILPLIEKHCWECHSAEIKTHGIALDSYDNIVIFGQEGSLYGSIVHDWNYAPMPWQKPKLDTCSITMVKKWIAAGMKNN
jgi:hypothetical protein